MHYVGKHAESSRVRNTGKRREQRIWNRVPVGREHLRCEHLRCEHLRCASILRCARGWYGCGGRPLRLASGGWQKTNAPYFFRRSFSATPPSQSNLQAPSILRTSRLRASYVTPGSQHPTLGGKRNGEDKKSLVSRNSLGRVGYRITLDSKDVL